MIPKHSHTFAAPLLCPGLWGDDLLSLPELMIFSNSSTSVPFPALRRPSGVTFPVPPCFLAAVLVPMGQSHVPLLSEGTLGCPELIAKHQHQSAVGRMKCDSFLPESHPGNALYWNVQQEKMVTSSARELTRPASVTANRCQNL